MMAIEQPATLARESYTTAENPMTPLGTKVQLYIQAADYYLQAAQLSTGYILKRSLAGLSSSALLKAKEVQGLLSTPITKLPTSCTALNVHTSQKETRTRSYNRAGCSSDLLCDIPHATVEDGTYQNRLLLKMHRGRIAGLSNLPRQAAGTAGQVICDMLSMEQSLSKLGFVREHSEGPFAAPLRGTERTYASATQAAEMDLSQVVATNTRTGGKNIDCTDSAAFRGVPPPSMGGLSKTDSARSLIEQSVPPRKTGLEESYMVLDMRDRVDAALVPPSGQPRSSIGTSSRRTDNIISDNTNNLSLDSASSSCAVLSSAQNRAETKMKMLREDIPVRAPTFVETPRPYEGLKSCGTAKSVSPETSLATTIPSSSSSTSEMIPSRRGVATAAHRGTVSAPKPRVRAASSATAMSVLSMSSAMSPAMAVASVQSVASGKEQSEHGGSRNNCNSSSTMSSKDRRIVAMNGERSTDSVCSDDTESIVSALEGSSDSRRSHFSGAADRERDRDAERDTDRATITVSNSADMVTSRYGQLAQSTTFQAQSNGNAEGVVRLLRTVETLGEENAHLMRQLDSMSLLEERHAAMQEEMELFKQVYTERFQRLKLFLLEYSSVFPQMALTEDAAVRLQNILSLQRERLEDNSQNNNSPNHNSNNSSIISSNTSEAPQSNNALGTSRSIQPEDRISFSVNHFNSEDKHNSRSNDDNERRDTAGKHMTSERQQDSFGSNVGNSASSKNNSNAGGGEFGTTSLMSVMSEFLVVSGAPTSAAVGASSISMARMGPARSAMGGNDSAVSDSSFRGGTGEGEMRLVQSRWEDGGFSAPQQQQQQQKMVIEELRRREAEQQQRIDQLERTVRALVEKYEKAKADSAKKDTMLANYSKLYKKLEKDGVLKQRPRSSAIAGSGAGGAGGGNAGNNTEPSGSHDRSNATLQHAPIAAASAATGRREPVHVTASVLPPAFTPVSESNPSQPAAARSAMSEEEQHRHERVQSIRAGSTVSSSPPELNHEQSLPRPLPLPVNSITTSVCAAAAAGAAAGAAARGSLAKMAGSRSSECLGPGFAATGSAGSMGTGASASASVDGDLRLGVNSSGLNASMRGAAAAATVAAGHNVRSKHHSTITLEALQAVHR